MPKAYVTARPQTIIEVFGCLTPRSIIEIYQNVAAKDQVKIAIVCHVLRIYHVGPRELDGIPEALVDLVLAIGNWFEIAVDYAPRQPHQRAVPIDALGGRPERASIDIRANDLDIVAVYVRPIFHQP